MIRRESNAGSRTSSNVTPNDAMIASQQQHIAELVSRNKALEHTISKLRAAVAEEKDRAADAVAQIQQQWKAERQEWREGCDLLQVSHRIAHLRTAGHVDREHIARLDMKEALRKEKLLRMHRDYKLVMFQAKELEMEESIAQLQWNLEKAVDERYDAVAEAEERADETMAVLEAQCAEVAEQLKEMAEEQERAVKEKEKLEVRLSHSSCTVDMNLFLRQIFLLCARNTPSLQPRLTGPQRSWSAPNSSSKVSRPLMGSSRRSTPSPRGLSLLSLDKWRSGRTWRTARTRTWRTCARPALNSRSKSSNSRPRTRSSKPSERRRRPRPRNSNPT